MKRRTAGFSFVEILVVMAIIAVLATLAIAIIPRIQEGARQTKSTDNVKQLVSYYIADGVGVKKSWPGYNGKSFTLWLVAFGKVDKRDDKQLQLFFSPGDEKYGFDKPGTKEAMAALTRDSLRSENPDLWKLTSYAGRRNNTDGHRLTSDELSRGALCLCDDDDGALHHPKGLVIGYTGGSARFVEWDELDMSPPQDPKNPEGVLGDQSPNKDLQSMSSQN